MILGLKRSVGMFVGIALSVAVFAGLPAMAEAQGMDRDTGAATSVKAPGDATRVGEPPAPGVSENAVRLVVRPGDSLWSISQDRLRPNATPQQILSEVERIYALNQDVIGGDPNLILPGQELSLPPLAEPAVAGQVSRPSSDTASSRAGPDSTTETASRSMVEGPIRKADSRALPKLARAPTPEPLPALAPAASPVPEVFSKVYDYERRLLGLVIFALTVATAVLMLCKLPMRRDARDAVQWRIPSGLKSSAAHPSTDNASDKSGYLEGPRRPAPGAPGNEQSVGSSKGRATPVKSGLDRVGLVGIPRIKRRVRARQGSRSRGPGSRQTPRSRLVLCDT